MFSRRRRFGRRFRRGRRRIFFKRATKDFHNVNIGTRTLAANTTETIGLLTVADSPDHTLVSDATNIAEAENNSRIISGRVRFECASSGGLGDPLPVAVLVWKDASHGAIANPTTAGDVLAPSTTLQLSMLKKYTCMFRKFYITATGDRHIIHLKIPRRMRQLRQGERILITVSNLEAATDSIEWFAYGKFITTT